MTRKRGINDWRLWLMVFRLYMDEHSWTSLGFWLLGAGFLYAVTEIIDEKMEEKNVD